MTLKLTHILDDRLQLHYGGKPLLEYVFVSTEAAFESPRPYFCPMYSLAGDELTAYRPYDHLWHVGLSMTWTYLNDQNFWGGNTYVHGEGYKPLDNVGRTDHVSWNVVTCDADHVHLDHNLSWITSSGETWLNERRVIDISTRRASDGIYSLAMNMTFLNVSGTRIKIGSPMTAGRPLAGYGGLFWRGPRSFTGGNLFSADHNGEAIVTHPKSWVAFSGPHDGTGNHSTLVFVDSPQNLRYPTKWWGRNEQFACISSSFVYDEAYHFEPDTTLTLRYQVLICNGALDRDGVSRLLESEQLP